MSKVIIGAILSPEEEQRQRNLALGLKSPSTSGGSGNLVESGTKILDTLSNLFGKRTSGQTVPSQPYQAPAKSFDYKPILLIGGAALAAYLIFKK